MPDTSSGSGVPTRSFSLRDALLLVATAGGGLAMTKDLARLDGAGYQVMTNVKPGNEPGAVGNGRLFFDQDFFLSGSTVHKPSEWMCLGTVWAMPCLTTFTLFALASGLAGGRGARRGACEAVGFAAVLALAFNASTFPSLLQTVGTSQPWPARDAWLNWRVLFWYTLPRPAGMAVAAAWAGLRLGRPRERTGRWQDRAAVGLGALWIGLAVTNLAARWVQLFGH